MMAASGSGSNSETNRVLEWIGAREVAPEGGSAEGGEQAPEYQVDGKPIEPEKKRSRGPSMLRWAIFLLIVAYGLLSYYSGPLLTRMGNYLVVEHEPPPADLIVCMMGGNVDRGLTVADLYQRGMAPKVFAGREEPPGGLDVLAQRNVHYPETQELLVDLLAGLGVPRDACVTAQRTAGSTWEEVGIIMEFARKQGYTSLIVVTEPIHTRRTWMAFQELLENDEIRVSMVASRHSGFQADGWWKSPRHTQSVLVEYEKLIYYSMTHFW